MTTRIPVWRRVKPPSTAPSPYLRPVLFLAGILITLVLLAALLSGPLRTQVDLHAECIGVIAPADMSFTVSTSHALRFYWYRVEIKRANESWCALPAPALDPAEVPVLTLEPAVNESPALDFEIGQGVLLTLKEQDQGRILELSHQGGGRVLISAHVMNATLVSENLTFGQPGCKPLDPKHRIKSNGIPAEVKLSSIQPPKPDLQAKAEIPLLGPNYDFGSDQLRFVGRWGALGCQSVKILRQGLNGVLGDSTNMLSRLEVDWTHLESMKMSISGASPPRFAIHALGTARDIQENGRQMLPPLFEDLAGRSTQQKGVVGVVGAILILTAGILLKRAVDILAQLLLPDPRR